MPLYHAPLPNVFSSGGICWGSVELVANETSNSLAADFARLLGTAFNSHGVSGKSKQHPADVRKHLVELEARHAKRYPTADLLPAKRTLKQVVGEAE